MDVGTRIKDYPKPSIMENQELKLAKLEILKRTKIETQITPLKTKTKTEFPIFEPQKNTKAKLKPTPWKMLRTIIKGNPRIGEPTNIGGYFSWHVKSLLWFLLIKTKLKTWSNNHNQSWNFFYCFFKTKAKTWDSTYLCIEQKIEPKYMSLKEKVIRIKINW